MTLKNKLLIYGAAGYTGKIIAARAKELNLNFEIAGREADMVARLAAELNVSYHIFTIEDDGAWQKALADKKVLINAAGPFRFTAKQAMEACLKAGVHYLDISAELDTYQLAESLDEEASMAGIQLLSGAGLFVSYDALDKKLVLIADGIVQTAGVYPHSFCQIAHGCTTIPLLPKDIHSFGYS